MINRGWIVLRQPLPYLSLKAIFKKGKSLKEEL